MIAIVFDRLTPEARGLARKAATTYAEEGFTLGDFTGVFAIDLSLRPLQTYTDNQQLVKKAIEDATMLSTSTYASNTQQVRSIGERAITLERQVDAGTAAAATSGAARDSAGAGSARCFDWGRCGRSHSHSDAGSNACDFRTARA